MKHTLFACVVVLLICKSSPITFKKLSHIAPKIKKSSRMNLEYHKLTDILKIIKVMEK